MSMAPDAGVTPAPAGTLHHASDGGLAGSHDQLPRFPAMLSPTVDDKFNRITAGLEALACWRVDDVRFQFDSSFPLPELSEELAALADLREQHAANLPASGSNPAVRVFPPLSLFGHADPVGDDDYNKQLSGRRAYAIYRLLIRDVAGWEKLYSTRIRNVGDVWGQTAVNTMLAALGFAGSDAVKQFQGANNLGVDGDPGPATRAALYQAYMDKLAGTMTLQKQDDFLAGTDPDARGDVQGCSEFNPLRLFSQDELTEFKKPENKVKRDEQNAPNRRVLVLLFRPGSRINVTKWPCPIADQNAGACRKRFWSDATDRLANGAERREFATTADTFACRFYQRLVASSPCEGIIPLVTLRLRIIDDTDKPYDTLSYTLVVDAFTLRGTLANDGVIERRIPAGTTTGTLTLTQPGQAADAPAFWTMTLAITDTFLDSSDIGGAQGRLNNLGLFAAASVTGQQDDQTRRAIQRFQTRYKVPGADGKTELSGDLTAQTAQKLKDIHAG